MVGFRIHLCEMHQVSECLWHRWMCFLVSARAGIKCERISLPLNPELAFEVSARVAQPVRADEEAENCTRSVVRLLQ